MIEDKKYVNQVLGAIRIMDARAGYPRAMSSFILVMNNILSETEKLVFKHTVVEQDDTIWYIDKMAKSTYYKVLHRVYDKCAAYITNNVEVLGL